LSANNPLAGLDDIERRNNILKNYWKGIAELLVDPAETDTNSVLFKTSGLDLFCIVSPTVFAKLFVDNDFRAERIKSIFKNAFDHLPNDYLAIQSPAYWQSGGGASKLNKQAVRGIATEVNKAINTQARSGNIKL
jgi:hypothetical protein